MQIAETTMAMGSSRQFRQELTVRERIEVWNRPESGRGPAPGSDLTVRLSAAAEAASGAAAAIDEAAEAAENDPMLGLLRAVIEWLTGKPVDVFDKASVERRSPEPEANQPVATSAPARTGNGFGLVYDRWARFSEEERTQFAAEGVVRTTDGREIRFTIQLDMRRKFELETHESLQIGTARRKDPLVINFAGNAAQLSDQRFRIDLDRDGVTDEVHFVAAGSGFLVFDRNGDGQVNDGSELFGTRSGNGFADLAELDEDGNGWIDSGDLAFARLRVWTMGDSGPQLAALADAGIGALSTHAVQSDFALRDSSNTPLGDIRRSGIYLYEDGRAGSIQQVDLVV